MTSQGFTSPHGGVMTGLNVARLQNMARGYLTRRNANNIKSEVRRLKTRVSWIQSGIEYHHIDLAALNGTTITSTAQFVALNLCAQGDSEVQREGQKITLTSLLWRGAIFPGTVDSHIRLLIFWDKQTNGALPTLTDVLDNTIITSSSYAPRNLEGSQRFVFIMDWAGVIPAKNIVAVANPSTQPVNKSFKDLKGFKKFKSKKNKFMTKFNAATAAIGSITTGSLIVMVLGDQAANGPVIYLGTRVRFMDL